MSATALELLKTLVSIPSVNPFRYFPRPDGVGFWGLGAEEKMNLYLEQYLRDAGFEVTRQELHPSQRIETSGEAIEIPARWNLLAVRYPKQKWNGKSILLFGHTDTVDVKKGWETDPFQIAVKSTGGIERWYGLGANDMKGGLAAILDAAKNTECNQYALKIALVVDEEFYSFGADTLCSSPFLDDVVLAIAPEIGDTLNEGSKDQLIGIGRTGRVEFDVHVTGIACHGADAFLSKEMVNAVHESVKLQNALIEDFNRVKRTFTQNGASCINAAYISYHNGGEPMLSIPDRASFVIDRTFLPDESPEAELSRLKDLVATLQKQGGIDSRTQVVITPRKRPTPPCMPYITSLDSPEAQSAMKAVTSHSPSHSFYIGRSVADENRIATRGISTLTIGPSGSGSHTNQEWVDPLSVVQANSIFKAFLTTL